MTLIDKGKKILRLVPGKSCPVSIILAYECGVERCEIPDTDKKVFCIKRFFGHFPIDINVRIISATNRNLKELVDRGAFREDLFYRINVIPITVPPLRERIGDIPLLAEAFFRRIRLKSAKNIEGISNDALKILMAYHWPGNARELKSAFEYAFVTCQESMIQPYHLPPSIFQGAKRLVKSESRSPNREDSKKKELIEALLQAGGNQSEAARILGVSRVTIWNRIKKYGIDLRPTINT